VQEPNAGLAAMRADEATREADVLEARIKEVEAEDAGKEFPWAIRSTGPPWSVQSKR